MREWMGALAVVLGAILAIWIVVDACGWKMPITLPDGSRANAVRDVVREPHITIRRSRLKPRLRRWVPIALAVGVGVFALTQWVVMAVAGAVAVLATPYLRERQRDQRVRLAKAETLPRWCEMLRDKLQGAHGLETVIKATAPVAPVILRRDTSLLAAALARGLSLRDALMEFADRVGDPVCDQVVMGLLRIEDGEGGSVLGSIADSARDALEVRRRVEAARSKVRRRVETVRSIARWTARFTIAIAVLFALIIFDRKYLAAYGGGGQFLLVFVLTFVACDLWVLVLAAEGAMPLIRTPHR